ncbi:hypothetical protein D3C87_1972810 [compost metagenome]
MIENGDLTRCIDMHPRIHLYPEIVGFGSIDDLGRFGVSGPAEAQGEHGPGHAGRFQKIPSG